MSLLLPTRHPATVLIKGSVDASLSANLPSSPANGDQWIISVAGNFEDDALIVPANYDFTVGDSIIWDGTNWLARESGDDSLKTTNNLSDLANTTTARTNLGLGNLATQNNPMTTAGDIITGGASGTPTRLAMGSALQVLRVNAGATALEYAADSGGMTWTTITSNTNASTNNGYIIDASSNTVALTLPSSPSVGAIIGFFVEDLSNAVSILRNGSKIHGIENDLSLLLNNFAFLVYVDAATGWKNIFDGSATSTPLAPANSGFTAGGTTGSYSNVIDKFAFSSNTTATDHGDLSVARSEIAGQSSATDGFASGGNTGAASNVIDKFSFSSNTTATDHGDLSVTRSAPCGQSSSTDGFSSGGGAYSNVVDKFAFSSNTTAADHGDLSVARAWGAGQSSSTDGFTSGGFTGANSNVIDKFAFSSNTTATDHGDLSVARNGVAGQSSSTDGFTSGGYAAGNSTNTVDKFAFSSNTTATDHGDLSGRSAACAGQSSDSQGFTSGGNDTLGTAYLNIVDKFNFSSNTTATDHGDLSVARYYVAGCEY